MMKVEFYTKKVCSLCEEAYALLKMLQNEYHFELDERDIYSNDEWLEEYQLLIPAVRIEDTLITCEEMSLDTLEETFKKNMGNN